MKKRLLALFLATGLLLSTSAAAFYTEGNLEQGYEVAEKLYELGLVKGISEDENGVVDHGLERNLTKMEMVTLLIRLLGKDAEAVDMEKDHPFTDVPSWADGYATYAYQNGLVNGISDTMMGAEDMATDGLYHTILLRALGYTDAEYADFSWDEPYDLSYFVGIRPVNLQSEYLLRSDALVITGAALFAEFKSTDTTLYEQLIEDGIFTAEKFDEIYVDGNPFKASPINGYFLTTDAILREYEGYDEFGDQYLEYGQKVMLTTDRPVTKFEMYSQGTTEMFEDELIFVPGEKIYETTNFNEYTPLVTWLTFPGSMAHYTFICTYEDGTFESYAIFGHGGLEHSPLTVSPENVSFG